MRSSIGMLLLASLALVTACKKKEDPKPPALPFEEQLAIDLDIIDTYLADNGIINVLKDCNTVKTPTGEPCKGYVSYVVHEEGNGLTPPSLNTQVVVSYKGRLLSNGTQFDANDSVTFSLGALIAGWQAVLLDMQEGDSVTMYIPSGYGYGYKGSGDIPSNANLIFDMKLHTVK